jgi:tetratricopeptide (TPR) repeat protein
MAAYEGNRRLDAQRERSMSQGVDRTAVQGALGLLDLGRKLTLVPMARIEAGIAEAHELLSEPALAEPHYRRAIELAPDYSEGHLHLARLLAARGAADEATALLREAIAAQPDSPEVAVELSDLLVSKGDLQEAARLLQSQMDRHSDNASVRLAYDVVLARQGDVERAIADMRRLTDESPDFAEAHLKLGMLLAHQEQYAEALAAFERVIALQPASVPALSLASLAAVKLGRADLGLRRLESAWRLDPFNAQIVGTWAALVARTDGLVAAIGSAERASRSDRAARFRLLFLYRAAGRQADAARLAPEFSDLAPAR